MLGHRLSLHGVEGAHRATTASTGQVWHALRQRPLLVDVLLLLLLWRLRGSVEARLLSSARRDRCQPAKAIESVQFVTMRDYRLNRQVGVRGGGSVNIVISLVAGGGRGTGDGGGAPLLHIGRGYRPTTQKFL